MYFKAIVTDEEIRIKATNDIKEAMMSVTMICKEINGTKEYSESDRAVFRAFVKEELAKLAFADADELVKEQERLAKKVADKKQKNLERILKELSELLDFDEEENEDEDEDE